MAYHSELLILSLPCGEQKRQDESHEPLENGLDVLVVSASLTLAGDFKTINGKEYKNVTVSRQEPDGIFVTNAKAGLMVKLYFAELPKEVQERFGYKPEKAVAYQSA